MSDNCPLCGVKPVKEPQLDGYQDWPCGTYLGHKRPRTPVPGMACTCNQLQKKVDRLQAELPEQQKYAVVGKQLLTMIEGMTAPEIREGDPVDGYIRVYEKQKAEIGQLQANVAKLRDVIQDAICDPDLTCAPDTMSKLQAARGEALDRMPSPLEWETLHKKATELQADVQTMAELIGCLELSEEGLPSCDPPCVACRNRVAEAKEVSDGIP